MPEKWQILEKDIRENLLFRASSKWRICLNAIVLNEMIHLNDISTAGSALIYAIRIRNSIYSYLFGFTLVLSKAK